MTTLAADVAAIDTTHGNDAANPKSWEQRLAEAVQSALGRVAGLIEATEQAMVNADLTLTTAGSQVVTLNTALTAARNLLLPSDATSKKGEEILFIRTAAATGAYAVVVKDSASTTIKSLAAAASNSARFRFNGTSWVLTDVSTL